MRSPSLPTTLCQLGFLCFISSHKALLNSVSPSVHCWAQMGSSLIWPYSVCHLDFLFIPRSLCLVTSVWFLAVSSVFGTLHIMNRVEVVTEDKFIRNKDWDSSWSFMWAFLPQPFIRFCSSPIISWRKLPQSPSLIRVPADDFCPVDGAQFF